MMYDNPFLQCHSYVIFLSSVFVESEWPIIGSAVCGVGKHSIYQHTLAQKIIDGFASEVGNISTAPTHSEPVLVQCMFLR
jgi:hypothetical protein